MSRFTEVAERVWVARYESSDVNVSVVEGAAGIVVVDTNTAAGIEQTLQDLRVLSARPVVAIVNTHGHFDHVEGNSAVGLAYDRPPVTAHERAAARIEPRPDRTFSSVTTIDLGDRALELVHPGRGHTDGDLVVRVVDARADADVLLAGDLVEESGAPAYGDDSYPMDWPLSLDLVLELIGADTLVVPGHGAPVTRAFVEEQRAAIGVVAETIRDLAGRGVRVDDALAATQWPYPAEVLGHAVRRGYEQLPSSQKRLPLL
ncbi:MAG: MBL fold metallo-hydrolase [Marmoricola sp.]|nr:MBL fold metallo-hydrolase [Marmoricola sp.]